MVAPAKKHGNRSRLFMAGTVASAFFSLFLGYSFLSGSSTAGYDSSVLLAIDATTAASSQRLEAEETGGDSDRTPKFKILGFANHQYRVLAQMWHDRLKKLGYTEQVIVTLDDEGYKYFKELGGLYNFESFEKPPFPEAYVTLPYALKTRKIREFMFASRWMYIQEQLEQGFSVVLTDVDNIFNRYVPLTDFLEYDVIHAYETIFPQHVFKEQGFTVCGGMSFLKADPKVIEFVKLFRKQCGVVCDDQVMLNSMMAFNLNITWHPRSEPEVYTTSDSERFDKLPTKARTGVSKVTGHRIKIWDRSFAFRGELYPENCPENNWVAMPFPASKDNTSMTRGNIDKYKKLMFEEWDKTCGKDSKKHQPSLLTSNSSHSV